MPRPMPTLVPCSFADAPNGGGPEIPELFEVADITQLISSFHHNSPAFANGENLVTFSKWRGFDAEAIAAAQNGFPMARTYSFGIELGF